MIRYDEAHKHFEQGVPFWGTFLTTSSTATGLLGTVSVYECYLDSTWAVHSANAGAPHYQLEKFVFFNTKIAASVFKALALKNVMNTKHFTHKYMPKSALEWSDQILSSTEMAEYVKNNPTEFMDMVEFIGKIK